MLEQCLPYDPLLNLPSPVLNFKVRARQILLCFYFIFSTISNFSSLSVNEILLSHIFIYCEMPEVFSFLFKTHLFTFTYFQAHCFLFSWLLLYPFSLVVYIFFCVDCLDNIIPLPLFTFQTRSFIFASSSTKLLPTLRRNSETIQQILLFFIIKPHSWEVISLSPSSSSSSSFV